MLSIVSITSGVFRIIACCFDQVSMYIDMNLVIHRVGKVLQSSFV